MITGGEKEVHSLDTHKHTTICYGYAHQKNNSKNHNNKPIKRTTGKTDSPALIYAREKRGREGRGEGAEGRWNILSSYEAKTEGALRIEC